jgi:Tfp pilus assembly protein PilX
MIIFNRHIPIACVSVSSRKANYAAPVTAQSGFVLVAAMIILMILTIFGVTVMNMTSLQTKMAGNTQENVRSFQTADSGNERGVNDDANFANLDQTNGPNTASYGIGSTTANIQTTVACWRCDPGRSSNASMIFSARSGSDSQVKATIYALETSGSTALGIKSYLTQNVRRITK